MQGFINYNNKYNQSCHNCEMRYVGCHSKCDKYKEEKALRTKEVQGLILEHKNQTLGKYREIGRRRRMI